MEEADTRLLFYARYAATAETKIVFLSSDTKVLLLSAVHFDRLGCEELWKCGFALAWNWLATSYSYTPSLPSFGPKRVWRSSYNKESNNKIWTRRQLPSPPSLRIKTHFRSPLFSLVSGGEKGWPEILLCPQARSHKTRSIYKRPLHLLKGNIKKRRAEILHVLPNEREKEKTFFHQRLTVCDSR